MHERWPVNQSVPNPAVATQSVRVIAVPERDGYLVECSECGPLGIMAAGMQATCRDHLRSHGAKL